MEIYGYDIYGEVTQLAQFFTTNNNNYHSLTRKKNGNK